MTFASYTNVVFSISLIPPTAEYESREFLLLLCTRESEKQPEAAPAPKAAPVVTPAAPAVDPNQNIAVIAAAVAAYGGDAKIVAVRPIESAGWKSVGRVNGVQNTVF